MIKKEIGIGFATGLLSNVLGILIYILILSELTIWETIKTAAEGKFLGTLIAAGAILNFLPFFFFLNRKRPYRARGVLLASILAALIVAGFKLF